MGYWPHFWKSDTFPRITVTLVCLCLCIFGPKGAIEIRYYYYIIVNGAIVTCCQQSDRF